MIYQIKFFVIIFGSMIQLKQKVIKDLNWFSSIVEIEIDWRDDNILMTITERYFCSAVTRVTDVMYSSLHLTIFLIKHSFSRVLLLLVLYLHVLCPMCLCAPLLSSASLLCRQYDINSRDRFQHILVEWLSLRGVHSKPLAIIFGVRSIFIAFPLFSHQKEERNVVKIFA